MKQPDITFVIPAYNEETNIRLGALDKVARYLETRKYTWEVIVVNDGSDDATAKLVSDFVRTNRGFRMIDNPHRGKAATVVTGMMAAVGDIVFFSDLDQATPIGESEKLLPWFSEGYDVVIGSRMGRREGAPMFRRIMARGFMILRTVFLGLKGISDTQCGFKAFRRSAVRQIVGKLQLYVNAGTVAGAMVTAGFDVEVLYIARVLGYRIKEVPVEWHYVDTRRVSPIKDSIQALTDMVRIRLNAAQGRYR